MTPPTLMLLSALGGAIVSALLPARGAERSARVVALVASLATLGCALAAYVGFDRSAEADALQFVTEIAWIETPRIRFLTGVDGIGVILLLLTGIVGVACVLFSWNVTHRPRAFFAWMLLVIAGACGVFQSLDLVLLFLFYEAVILPKYFLIAIWGSKDREYGAMKLTLYSVAGGALVLLGVILIAWQKEAGGFSIPALAGDRLPLALQLWVFPLLCVGFGVLAGLWPLHTWAPTGHAAAPTAASMLLAGLVMKLGSFGILRVAMPLCADALPAFAPALAGLGAAGIVAAALVALSRRDLKLVIGYSSVAHMGFVLLGLGTLDRIGIAGAVLQMFSHGLIAGLLFAVVGRMLYDRFHTRDLEALGALGPGRALPAVTVIFAAAAAASMGMPGFSGFIAEVSVLLGTWKRFPWLLLPVGFGIVVTAAFTVRALQVVLGRTRPSAAGETPDLREPAPAPAEPITLAEKLGAALLLGTSVWAGIFPQDLLALSLRAIESPMLHGIVQTAEGLAR